MQKLIQDLKNLKNDIELKPDAVWKRQTLLTLRKELYQESAQVPTFFGSLLHLSFAPSRMIASVILIFFVSGGGFAFASQNAIPGDFLYSIKTATEDIQRIAAFTPERRIRINSKIASRRTNELEQLVRSQADPVLIEVTSRKIEEETTLIVAELKNNPDVSTDVIAVAEETIENNLATLKKMTAVVGSSSMPTSSDETIEDKESMEETNEDGITTDENLADEEKTSSESSQGALGSSAPVKNETSVAGQSSQSGHLAPAVKPSEQATTSEASLGSESVTEPQTPSDSGGEVSTPLPKGEESLSGAEDVAPPAVKIPNIGSTPATKGSQPSIQLPEKTVDNIIKSINVLEEAKEKISTKEEQKPSSSSSEEGAAVNSEDNSSKEKQDQAIAPSSGGEGAPSTVDTSLPSSSDGSSSSVTPHESGSSSQTNNSAPQSTNQSSSGALDASSSTTILSQDQSTQSPSVTSSSTGAPAQNSKIINGEEKRSRR